MSGQSTIPLFSPKHCCSFKSVSLFFGYFFKVNSFFFVHFSSVTDSSRTIFAHFSSVTDLSRTIFAHFLKQTLLHLGSKYVPQWLWKRLAFSVFSNLTGKFRAIFLASLNNFLSDYALKNEDAGNLQEKIRPYPCHTCEKLFVSLSLPFWNNANMYLNDYEKGWPDYALKNEDVGNLQEKILLLLLYVIHRL